MEGKPESVHMGDPAGGYTEMVMARNSGRGHLMAWHDKQAMQEYFEGAADGLKHEEEGTRHCDVIGSERDWSGTCEQELLECSPPEVFRRNHAYSPISNGVNGQSLRQA